jgi:hypothetical protein
MAPLYVPKSFKFKPLYPLPLQDGVGPSSSPPLFNNNPPIILFNTFFEDLCKQNFKKKGKLYESSQKFQDAWIVHLPWVESIVDDKGEVH